MSGNVGSVEHWDDAYAHGDATRSWFQRQPAMSLRMLDAAGVTPADSVIDVGGGASVLVDALLGRGFADITVLDISATAIGHARRRLGERAGAVHWLVADLLSWQPHRSYRVWHDRAVYHFLTTAPAQRRYRDALDEATGAGAVAVIGCFAPDGPQRCSGLPVARYSAEEIAGQLAGGWTLISQAREEHVTPAGIRQPFTWVTLRRHA
jgi:trans-aconitate methyltransferase